ncbi:MAG: hypothetical protein C5B60_00760 [Chloroflexi bacterium]|nr:MAG: hypothetical protein C5B60_00760 [Chloroflexota bacterium]
MAKPRVTATDRLSNVIEVVQMGRRTGLLSVERGAGSILEVGEIYFVSGSPIYASLSALLGREALAALGQWGPCRFAFDTDVTMPPANIPAFNPSQRSRPSDPGSLPGEPAPVFSTSSIYTNSRHPDASGRWALQANTGRHPRPGAAPHDSNPSQSQPFTSPQSGALDWQGRSPKPHVDTFGLRRRPRRAPDVRDLMAVVTAHNLSRSHRTVLLLADGEHTILDLARLSSKSVDEITVLLADLEVRGLVYYYAAE